MIARPGRAGGRPGVRRLGVALGSAVCLAATLGLASPLGAQAATGQNPSPMVEHTRAHDRLARRDVPGVRHEISGPHGRKLTVLVPPAVAAAVRSGTPVAVDVIVHFHGAAWLVEQAAQEVAPDRVVVVMHAGAGAGSYERAFGDPAAFDSVLAAVSHAASAPVGRVAVSAFSAGHGAVRAILREPRGGERIDAVLLLDGLHAAYVPARRPLADGGALDTTALTSVLAFARRAVAGERRLVVTHSEIFPGTFASTTETADWLLERLALGRTPVLRWGPRGMQQLGETVAGGLTLLAFAGNTAPDHVDHFHALPEMLRLLLRPVATSSGKR